MKPFRILVVRLRKQLKLAIMNYKGKPLKIIVENENTMWVVKTLKGEMIYFFTLLPYLVEFLEAYQELFIVQRKQSNETALKRIENRKLPIE